MKKLIIVLLAIFSINYGNSQNTSFIEENEEIIYTEKAYEKANYVVLYGYRLSDTDKSKAIISFRSSNPGSVSLKQEITDGQNAFVAGEYFDGYLYAFSRSSETGQPQNFVKISTSTWTIESTISIEDYPKDMAYDYITKKMYGITGNSSQKDDLCEVDLETGKMKTIVSTDRQFYTLACNLDGKVYGVDTDGNFCSINKENGTVTNIGSTGFQPRYVQSMAFDHNTGKLFWAYINSETVGGLIEINVSSGVGTNLGKIGTNAEVIMLYTPFETALLKETTPSNNEEYISVDAEIKAVFNRNIASSTNYSGIEINPAISGLSASINGTELTIAHDDLEYNTEYTVKIPKNAIKVGENNLLQDIIWKFTTIPDPDICNAPTLLKTDEITSTSAVLSWRENSNSTIWNVKISDAKIDPSTEPGNILNVSETIENPISTNDILTHNTVYYLYVQSVCSTEDASSWSEEFEFITNIDCSVAITKFPHKESFEIERTFACWQNEHISGNINWVVGAGSGNGGDIETAYDGNKNFQFFNENTTSEVTKLITQKLDISQLENPSLSFRYTQQIKNGNQNELRVFCKDSETGEWIILFEDTKEQPDWKQIKLGLPNASDNYYIAFEGTAKSGYGIALDDVKIIDEEIIDVGILAMSNPEDGDLTNEEGISILIKNYGNKPITDFSATYKIDDAETITETVTETIECSEEFLYTFTTKADMSEYKIYNITASITLANDQNTNDNTITKNVTNSGNNVQLYGYRIYDDRISSPYAAVSFLSNDPGTVSVISTYRDGTNNFAAGEYFDGNIYAFSTDNSTGNPKNLIKISAETWAQLSTIEISFSPMDMSYNYGLDFMLAVVPISAELSNLYALELTTGQVALIANLDKFFYTLACDLDGKTYAIAKNGDFCSINLETGASTVIGHTGFYPGANYQSMTFDHKSERLFWALCTNTTGKLIEIDVETGQGTDLGSIGTNAEIIMLYTPYNYEKPLKVSSLTPENNATNVPVNTEISVTFNMEISAQTSDLQNITIIDENSNPIDLVSASISESKLIINHSILELNKTYTVNIPENTIEGYGKKIEWSFTTGNVNINETTSSKINIYPNPSIEDINIEVSEPAIIDLIDVYGRVIETYNVNSNSHLSIKQPVGVYFIKIKTNEKTITEKIIFQQ